MEREAVLLGYLVNGYQEFGESAMYFQEFWLGLAIVLFAGGALLYLYAGILSALLAWSGLMGS